MVHIYSGVLLSHKREQNLTICDNMGEHRKYYDMCNKRGREIQILCEFTCVCLKNRINKIGKKNKS